MPWLSATWKADPTAALPERAERHRAIREAARSLLHGEQHGAGAYA